MDVKNRKQAQSDATRAELISVARKLFAEKGYADTGTEEIVQRAGVTRGALYHHFRDKEALFEAVFEQVEQEFVRKLMQASASPDPWQGLKNGAQTFLDECLNPELQQIVLLDAPSALGWQRWKELDAKYGLGLVRAALTAAIESGLIERQPVDPLAHMLLGALTEAAMLIARADDIETTRREVGESVNRLLDSLRAS
jgi:AcrR family transcriptional regulator